MKRFFERWFVSRRKHDRVRSALAGALRDAINVFVDADIKGEVLCTEDRWEMWGQILRENETL